MNQATPHAGPILVFDSGVGGLSVLKEVHKALPRHRFVYAADDAGFPYGAWEEEHLVARVVALMERLIANFQPALVVIACNTASTLVLPALRARFAVPFVGTVPAIKPAAERTRSGLVSVLATPGTMKRDYTRALIADFAQTCHVRLVGAPALAGLAEAEARGRPAPDETILEQVAPCFVEQAGRRTDIVVLACTHYPFLVHRLHAVSPWPVTFLDPAPAIARRAASLLGDDVPATAGGEVAVTTGPAVDAALAAFYRSFGFDEVAPIDFAFARP